VTERRYIDRDPRESLDNSLAAREASLVWLTGLSSPNWEALLDAPFGQITAGDIFASWVAHDLLHMRQLVELHWAYTMTKGDPYRTGYAGTW
jgi:hypothetical protein